MYLNNTLLNTLYDITMEIHKNNSEATVVTGLAALDCCSN